MLAEAVDVFGGQPRGDLHELIGEGQASQGRVEEDGAGGFAEDAEGENRIGNELDVVERRRWL